MPDVAVVGAGVAGLTVAAALARFGRTATVYEQAVTPDAGGGIQLSPNATRLLHRLGLAERLAEVGVQPAAVELRRWDSGDVIGRTELGRACADRFGAPYYTLHRGDLHRILLDLVESEGPIRRGSTCVGVQEDADGVELCFASGARSTADVVIGADGIHSVVRRVLAADRPRWSGVTVYRGLIPAVHSRAKPTVSVWLGPGQHMVCYPVSGGRSVSFVASTRAGYGQGESWTEPGNVAELVAAYAGWHPEVRAVLAAAQSTTRWALHDRAPLPRWCTDRVALVGDAAQALLPFGAQGANQAIEGAMALAACLSRAGDDLPDALHRYQQVRAPRLARVGGVVREHVRNHHLDDGPLQRQRDQVLRVRAGLRHQGWLYGYDAERAALAWPSRQGVA
jgi:salicylate hydroxylase